jgi:hypothetical protein
MTMSLKKYALAILLLLLPVVALAGAGPVITNTATVTADNQATGTGNGTATVSVPVLPGAAQPVPTLSTVGLTALTVLLAGLGVVVMRRRARRSA